MDIINCPFIPIASRVASHRGAQGVIYADMIGNCDVNYSGKIEDHNQYDRMWVYHGNDWNGGMNLFGGVYGFPYVKNTVNFSKFKGEVKSLLVDFPPYHEMIRDKIKAGEKKNKTIQPEWYEIDLDNLERMYNESETIKYPCKTKKMVVGDSHAICLYRSGWTVNSVPFKTCNGALNEGLYQYVDLDVDRLQFYFGNIDIRHHVCRLEGDLKDNVTELAERYVLEVKKLYNICDLKAPAQIFELLPIENESRKIPKSGWYKGQPFWGSWEERNAARNIFNKHIEDAGMLIKWTDHLINNKGELDFKYMEKPQSIHLSREFYPYWNGINSFYSTGNTLDNFLS